MANNVLRSPQISARKGNDVATAASMRRSSLCRMEAKHTGRFRRDRVALWTGRMRGSCPIKARTSFAVLAQSAERLTCNQEVGSSILPGGTKFSRFVQLAGHRALVLAIMVRIHEREPKYSIDKPQVCGHQSIMRSEIANIGLLPRPFQGVGKLGRSRRTWNAETAGSNPAALTTSLSLLSSRY